MLKLPYKSVLINKSRIIIEKILLILIPILIVVAGIAFAKQNIQRGDVMIKKQNAKILIAYFSWGGNTKHIAELIQKETNADMFRIETKTPYPSDYNETAYGVAKEQHDKNIHPELKDNGNVSDYDIVFVGTPAWWYTMTPAVMTFLENNSFEGKTIVPFITHGGGGKYQIKDDMAKPTKGAKVLEPLVVYERGNSDTQKEIVKWLETIK